VLLCVICICRNYMIFDKATIKFHMQPLCRGNTSRLCSPHESFIAVKLTLIGMIGSKIMCQCYLLVVFML
jgi:hypothetical protein